ncbi:hypothetical protein ZYGR_0AI03440 [Zygosaccharomyces rouxii]|uniref:Transcription factor VHR1 n=1 Tax=Zygosaccharomyces rouxii TaxID=4956 RepID=A0A1Q3ABK8_ZYGRO|nr:hypothetical protein ZYGR_0AI03440 [Zygosaccharomyces rouxii]
MNNPSYRSMRSTPYRVGKPVGNGTTHKIREQLNFSDEKKWKEFSGRRLELIDKFGLSERKASEQDDNIRQIATILRTEYGYPLSSANEFEKLVTAAVQSVRRNRKRSKKRSGGSGSCTSDEDITRMSSPCQIAVPPPAPPAPSASAPPSFNNQQLPAPLPVPPPVAPAVKNTIVPPRIPVIQSQQMYDDIVKSIIADLVNNTVPFNQQSQEDGDGPNLTDFALSSNDRNLLSLGLKNRNHSNHSPSLPFFLREKTLLQIQRSRSCFDMAFAQGSVEMYSNLEFLGEMTTRSAIVFVVERFFSNLMPSSMEYITSKSSSQESLSNLSIKLFGPASKRNLSQLPPKQVQLKVLFLTMGGLVKDFGFDPCLYPLSEIIHHLVMVQYPLLASESSLPHNSTYGQRTAVISSLSMKPQAANRDVNKKVFIRFKEREHQFTFHLLSNGPPTVNEVLENCKQLFQIVNQSKPLALYHDQKLVHEDSELARLFSNFTNDTVILEVRELSSTNLVAPEPSKPNELDGLKMLSAASLQVKRELTTPLPPPSPASSSQTALDNIINRIGSKSPIPQRNQSESPKELPSLPSVVGNPNRNFFQNGNLPQPVFQPLL